jgi:hypothetical protein
MVVAVTAACAFSAQFQVRNGHPSLRLLRANKRQR